MRATALSALIVASVLGGCTTFTAQPLTDVAPPRRVSIRSVEPFVASSEVGATCRLTRLTGPFAGVINDSVFVSRVDAHVRASDQATACDLRGRTGVATSDLTFGSQVLAEQLDGKGMMLGVVAVVAVLAIALLNVSILF